MLTVPVELGLASDGQWAGGPKSGGIRDPSIEWAYGQFWCGAGPHLAEQSRAGGGVNDFNARVRVYSSPDNRNWTHVVDLPTTGITTMGICHWVRDAAGLHAVGKISEHAPYKYNVWDMPSSGWNVAANWAVHIPVTVDGNPVLRRDYMAQNNGYFFYDFTSNTYYLLSEGGTWISATSLYGTGDAAWPNAADSSSMPPDMTDIGQPVILADGTLRIYYYDESDMYTGTILYATTTNDWRTDVATWSDSQQFTISGYTWCGNSELALRDQVHQRRRGDGHPQCAFATGAGPGAGDRRGGPADADVLTIKGVDADTDQQTKDLPRRRRPLSIRTDSRSPMSSPTTTIKRRGACSANSG